MSSYPPPPKRLEPPSVNPRPSLAPLGIAPSMVSFDPDSIPNPQLRAFDDCHSHSTSVHFTPAAFPRCASTPGRIELPAHLAGPERKDWVKKTAMDLIIEKRALEKDLVKGRGVVQEGPERVVSKVGLWNSVLRIARRKNWNEKLGKDVKSVTIVATHANGLHKETWEVPFRKLIELTERFDSPVRIEAIWVLECVDHGDSALANGSNFPRLADRSDYARDIANFCLHYLPERSDADPGSSKCLLRVNQIVSRRRQVHGFEKEGISLLGVGHSLGGDSMIHCALSYPGLFHSLAISETTLLPGSRNSNEAAFVYVRGALGRRAAWPSREDAKLNLLKSPMYAAFHPEVLESYIAHALYEDKINGGVRLKCEPEFETCQFNELLSMNEAWELLPNLDEKVTLHWIMGGLESSSNIVGGAEIAQNTVWRRHENTTNIRIPGAGHLVVQERPWEYSQELFQFLLMTFSNTPRQLSAKL